MIPLGNAPKGVGFGGIAYGVDRGGAANGGAKVRLGQNSFRARSTGGDAYGKLRIKREAVAVHACAAGNCLCPSGIVGHGSIRSTKLVAEGDFQFLRVKYK